MASHVSRLESLRRRNHARTDDEKGREQVDFGEVVQELGSRCRWAIIERETPSAFRRAEGDVRVASAAACEGKSAELRRQTSVR